MRWLIRVCDGPDPVSEAVAVTAGIDTLADQAILQRAPSRPSILASIRRQPLALTGLIIIVLFAIVAIFGRYVAPHGPTQQFSKHIL